MEDLIEFDKRHLRIRIDESEVIIGNLSFEVINRVDKHAKLTIAGVVYDQRLVESLCSNKENKITLEITKGEEVNRIIFSGLIDSLKMWRDIEGTHIDMEALSNSIKMDRKKSKVSYQDQGVDFESIVGKISENYTNDNISIVGENLTVVKQNKLLVQYNESDWEFLLRLASLDNRSIFNKGNGIKVGFSTSSKNVKLDLDSAKHYILRESGKSYLSHRVETTQILLIGEGVAIEKSEDVEEQLVVIESRYRLEDTYLIGEYTLVNPTLYSKNKLSNSSIVGKAVEGIVNEVLEGGSGAKVKVEFNRDLKKSLDATELEVQLGENLFEFPYITPYSQNHTGFFCSPEIGDNVVVYFPTEDEEDGFVIGSLNNIGSERFSNRLVRNYIIPGAEESEEVQLELTIENGSVVIRGESIHKEVEDETAVINNNRVVEVNNSYSVKVAKDYMSEGSKIMLNASDKLDIKGSSSVNMKGGEVKVEADSSGSIKAGSSLNIGSASINLGS